MSRKKNFDAIVESGIRQALDHHYERDADWLKALEVAKDWSKVKHKIEESEEGSALLDEETLP